MHGEMKLAALNQNILAAVSAGPNDSQNFSKGKKSNYSGAIRVGACRTRSRLGGRSKVRRGFKTDLRARCSAYFMGTIQDAVNYVSESKQPFPSGALPNCFATGIFTSKTDRNTLTITQKRNTVAVS